MNEIVFIVGPTGTGKSDLAVKVAARKNAAILNIDSVQTFKHVQIGAAKPTSKMREMVPHYLFDVVAAGETLTAGEYRRQALPLINTLIAAKNIFVVGGSGFYVQALEHGMFEVEPVPEEILEAVEKEADEKGNAFLWDELNRLDPKTASKIHVNDTYRLKRANSLLRAHGKPLSATRAEFEATRSSLSDQYPVRKVGLNLKRERLKERIVMRTEHMISTGLIEEVEGLLKMGLRHWSPLKSVGYAETIRFLDGELTRPQLFEEIVKSTMALAKRQVTWFKRDQEIRWYDAETELTAAEEYLLMGPTCEV